MGNSAGRSDVMGFLFVERGLRWCVWVFCARGCCGELVERLALSLATRHALRSKGLRAMLAKVVVAVILAAPHLFSTSKAVTTIVARSTLAVLLQKSAALRTLRVIVIGTHFIFWLRSCRLAEVKRRFKRTVLFQRALDGGSQLSITATTPREHLCNVTIIHNLALVWLEGVGRHSPWPCQFLRCCSRLIFVQADPGFKALEALGRLGCVQQLADQERTYKEEQDGTQRRNTCDCWPCGFVVRLRFGCGCGHGFMHETILCRTPPIQFAITEQQALGIPCFVGNDDDGPRCGTQHLALSHCMDFVGAVRLSQRILRLPTLSGKV